MNNEKSKGRIDCAAEKENVYIFYEKLNQIDYESQHRAGRELLKRAVREVYGQETDKLRIVYTERGKPMFDESAIFFNISHSRCTLALALSQVEVGIDVEEPADLSAHMVERVFSESERREATQFRDESEYYTRLWTLKESFLKCLGTGITFPLTDLSFRVADTYPFATTFDGHYLYQDKVFDSILSVCTRMRETDELGKLS